jgi:hypothetical protein
MDTLTISLEGKSLSAIAEIIRTNWVNPSPYALPYLEALEELNSVNDDYYADTALSVVIYFLANAQTWRGDTARIVKAHLKSLVK